MTTGPAFTVSDDEPGTSEDRWRVALQSLDPPGLDLPVPNRVLVIAPHPDDEVLGVGGLVRRWALAGAEVVVVAVTDGERSDPTAGALGRRLLGARRAGESRRALRSLGVVAEVRRLSVPDGQVAGYGATVQQAVEEATRAGTVCATTWRGDGHPDHEATGRATAAACAATGIRLLEFPVWMWHWAAPGDRRVPWSSARATYLDRSGLVAKHAAIGRFRSQAAVLPEPVLDRFRRSCEVVFQ